MTDILCLFRKAAAADVKKVEGNNMYKEKSYKEALNLYTEAIGKYWPQYFSTIFNKKINVQLDSFMYL